MALIRPNQKEPGVITRSEWCFDDCPPDLVRECWDYEHAREVPAIVAEYRREREAGNYVKPGVIAITRATHAKDGSPVSLDVIQLTDGFPEKPFMESDYQALLRPRPRSVSVEDREGNAYQRAFHRQAQERLVAARSDSREGMRAHLKEVLPELRNGIAAFSPGIAVDAEMAGIITVDFRFSKTALKKGFAQWLERNWREQPNAVDKLGSSPQLKTDLAALGRWRLLKMMTPYQAQAWFDDRGEKVPKESNLSAAKKRAEANIESLKGRFS